jgi:hypothetical protein
MRPRPAGTYRIRGRQRAVTRGARAPRGFGSFLTPLWNSNAPLNCSVLPFGGVGLVEPACWCLEMGSYCDSVMGKGSLAAAMALNSPQTAYQTATLPTPPPPAGPSTVQQETVFGTWTPSDAIAGTDWGAYQQAVQDYFSQVASGVTPPAPPTALNPLSIAAIGIGVIALIAVLSPGKGRR